MIVWSEVLAVVLATASEFIRNCIQLRREFARHADLCAAAEGGAAL
jgi:hypothetical protein